MSNQYDTKLYHRFFYSGYKSSGTYAAANTHYRDNEFYSYRTCIAIVIDSVKCRTTDPTDPKGKRTVPQKVMIMETGFRSNTTSSHKQDLKWAAPGDVALIYAPFTYMDRWRPGTTSHEYIAKGLYERAVNAANAPLTNRPNISEFRQALQEVAVWERHFGVKMRPKTYKVITKMRALLEDEAAYAEYKKTTLTAMRKESTIRNASIRASLREEAFKREWRANITAVDTEKRGAIRSLKAAFAEEAIAVVEKQIKALLSIDMPEVMKAAYVDDNDAPISYIRRQLQYYTSWRFLARREGETHDAGVLECIREAVHNRVKPADLYCGRPRSGFDYVVPKLEVRWNNTTDSIDVTVSDTYMETGRGVRVSTKEVLHFLKLRERGGRLLGEKFAEGYRFLLNDTDAVHVGCHKFKATTVDALNEFMKLGHEAISAMYKEIIGTFNKAYRELAEGVRDIWTPAVEEKYAALMKNVEAVEAEYAQKRQDKEREANEAVAAAGYTW